MRIESNRKVPQTNRLSLAVLDMDAFNIEYVSGNLKKSDFLTSAAVISSQALLILWEF